MWDKNVTTNTYGFSRSHTDRPGLAIYMCVSIRFGCGSHLLNSPTTHQHYSFKSAASVLQFCIFLWTITKTTCVCLYLQPLADTFSFLHFMSTVPMGPVGHISYHNLIPQQANHDHFKVLPGPAVLAQLFLDYCLVHVNYLVASTSVHSNTVHRNMTLCVCVGRCILTYKVNNLRWAQIKFLAAQWQSLKFVFYDAFIQ